MQPRTGKSRYGSLALLLLIVPPVCHAGWAFLEQGQVDAWVNRLEDYLAVVHVGGLLYLFLGLNRLMGFPFFTRVYPILFGSPFVVVPALAVILLSPYGVIHHVIPQIVGPIYRGFTWFCDYPPPLMLLYELGLIVLAGLLSLMGLVRPALLGTPSRLRVLAPCAAAVVAAVVSVCIQNSVLLSQPRFNCMSLGTELNFDPPWVDSRAQ